MSTREVEKIRFNKFVVTAIIMFVMAFIVAVLFISFFDHSVPDSLIMGVFAFATGELWAVAVIKIKEEPEEGDSEDEEVDE